MLYIKRRKSHSVGAEFCGNRVAVDGANVERDIEKAEHFTLSGRCICTVIYYQAMMKLKNDCYHFCRNHGVNFKNHITNRVHVKIRNN